MVRVAQKVAESRDPVTGLSAQSVEYRHRHFQFLAIVGIVTALVLIPFLLVWGLKDAAIACMIYAPLCALIIWRSAKDPEWLGLYINIILCANLFVTLSGIYFQRPDAVIDPWIMVCPVAAFALCKRQVAVLWTTLTVLMLFVVHHFAPYPVAMLSTVLLAGCVVALSSILYVFSRYVEDNERLIVELSNIDPLTNTLNRRSFDDVMVDEFRRNLRQRTSMSAFMVDADHFKLYNDHYGHVRGDGVLARIAEALKQSSRRSGDFVFRYGGEEFCVLSSGLDEQQAAAFAETLRTNVESLALDHSDTLLGRVSVSVGYRHAHSLEALIPEQVVEQADKALYQAKANGRNCVVSYSATSASA